MAADDVTGFVSAFGCEKPRRDHLASPRTAAQRRQCLFVAACRFGLEPTLPRRDRVSRARLMAFLCLGVGCAWCYLAAASRADAARRRVAKRRSARSTAPAETARGTRPGAARHKSDAARSRPPAPPPVPEARGPALFGRLLTTRQNASAYRDRRPLRRSAGVPAPPNDRLPGRSFGGRPSAGKSLEVRPAGGQAELKLRCAGMGPRALPHFLTRPLNHDDGECFGQHVGDVLVGLAVLR